MRKPKIIFLLALIFLNSANGYSKDDSRQLYQFSTIGALKQGIYEGIVDCGELKKNGDFGLGTFDGLGGELIQIDGKFYKVKMDGMVYPVDDAEKVPFIISVFFKPDKKIDLPQALDFASMQAYLDSVLESKNMIYALKINGTFTSIKTRSVAKYDKPYPPLSEAVKNQKEFELKNVRGTLVGFWFPNYLKEVNVAGYHFHFLTEDKKAGGHVLDFSGASLNAGIEEIHSFTLDFPNSEDFKKIDLQEAKSPLSSKLE